MKIRKEQKQCKDIGFEEEVSKLVMRKVSGDDFSIKKIYYIVEDIIKMIEEGKTAKELCGVEEDDTNSVGAVAAGVMPEHLELLKNMPGFKEATDKDKKDLNLCEIMKDRLSGEEESILEISSPVSLEQWEFFDDFLKLLDSFRNPAQVFDVNNPPENPSVDKYAKDLLKLKDLYSHTDKVFGDVYMFDYDKHASGKYFKFNSIPMKIVGIDNDENKVLAVINKNSEENDD